MRDFLRFFFLNAGKIIGTFLAFLISLFIVIFGMLKTFIIVLICTLGFFLGKWFDEGISPLNFLSEAVKSIKEGKWR